MLRCPFIGIFFIGVCLAMYDPGKNITIETRSSFQFENASDFRSYKINLEFSWKVNRDADFDGYLYKLEDKDDEMSGVHKKSIGRPMFRAFPFRNGKMPVRNAKSPCKKAEGRKIWIHDDGTDFECALPCDAYLTKYIQSNSLCTSLLAGYQVLPKNARNLTLPGIFGRVYELKMKPYRRREIGKVFQSKATEPIYCIDTLSKSFDIPYDVIKNFCIKNQKIADVSSASGPPADIERLLPEYDVMTNRGQIKFRWKSPHDISHRTVLDKFTVNANGGISNKHTIDADDHDDEGYYTATVTNVIFGRNNSISVRPLFKSDCTTELTGCAKYGHLINQFYVIEDINACLMNGSHERYCDDVANCIDQSASALVSSLCSCPVGYVGNGINETFLNGTGCTNRDSCADGNRICDVNAVCNDLLPPNDTATCFCPSGYIGDGYIRSSGCTSSTLILGLGVGLPLLLLLTAATLLAVWRSKVNKKRAIELTLSKFIVKHDDGNMNGHANGYTKSTNGIFGAKWEIDRNDVELKDIIGRGNFGVVYKAVLKTEEDIQTVALKMTPEASKQSDNQGFLAEISLISSIVKHENVMGMIGCCTVGGSSIWLITEFMKYGDLLHFLWDAREESNRKKNSVYDLTELSIYNVGKQIANGLNFLSGLKIIHGDVAARNVLVGEGLQCKISDFGLANDVYKYGILERSWEKKVPLKWISPERMMGGKVPISWRSDVWSFGILLYEAITLGASPYPGIPQERIFETLKLGSRMSRPLTCSKELYEIMLQCWKWTPSKRPTFRDIMKKIEAAILHCEGHYQNVATMTATLDTEACQSVVPCARNTDSAVKFSSDDAFNTQRNGNTPSNGEAGGVEPSAA